MKAMVLAAGLGERMRPLTDKTAKPLLKIGGKTIIENVLSGLQEAGVKEVVVNVSHYAKKIMQKLGDGSNYGLAIVYSYEGDDPLGTGGGIYKALPLLGEEPFILVSGDIWTDFPFASLFDKTHQDAHVVLVDNPNYNAKGDFGLANNGAVTLNEPKFTYGNIAVIHPRILQNAQAGNYSIVPSMMAAIEKGSVTGEKYQGNWWNVGTPEILNELRNRV